VMEASFHKTGRWPVCGDKLNICDNGKETKLAVTL